MEIKYLASLQELIDAIQSIDEQIIVHWHISRMDEARHVYRRYQASKAFPKYFLSYQDAKTKEEAINQTRVMNTDIIRPDILAHILSLCVNVEASWIRIYNGSTLQYEILEEDRDVFKKCVHHALVSYCTRRFGSKMAETKYIRSVDSLRHLVRNTKQKLTIQWFKYEAYEPRPQTRVYVRNQFPHGCWNVVSPEYMISDAYIDDEDVVGFILLLCCQEGEATCDIQLWSDNCPDVFYIKEDDFPEFIRYVLEAMRRYAGE